MWEVERALGLELQREELKDPSASLSSGCAGFIGNWSLDKGWEDDPGDFGWSRGHTVPGPLGRATCWHLGKIPRAGQGVAAVPSQLTGGHPM